MEKNSYFNEPFWIKRIIPFVVFLLSFLGYLKTVQPTVSFWDCGEFIATSYILGVPHPPGAPLFNIVGRFFSLLPLAEEVAVRINLISNLTSAFAILFLYLIIREFIAYFMEIKSLKDSIISSFSAASASLMAAFADTFWFNAVEAEVYAAAMFFMLLSVYLALVWYRKRKEKGSDRYLILMIYVMYLGIGAHLFSLLLFPAIFFLIISANRIDNKSFKNGLYGLGILFVIVWIINKLNAPGDFLRSILHDPLRNIVDKFFIIFSEKTVQTINSFSPEIAFISLGLVILTIWLINYFERKEIVQDWKYWVVFFQLTLVIYALDFFLWFNFWSLIAYAYYSFKSKYKYKFRFLLVTVLVAIIGYSSYLYVPIRANLDPEINENDPSSWKQFKVYLERKQYGEPDIWTRITHRKGSFSWQVGYMLNYLRNQFSHPILFPIWFFFFLLGLYSLMKKSKDRNVMLFAVFIFIIVSIGLVIYMNFSDGQHGVHAEVRDRDYFHTPTFLVFALFMGLGFATLLDYIRKFLKKDVVVMALAGIFLLLPIITYTYQLPNHDRSKDFLPNDYAHNILISCPPNAILFTQGDNDTFPLWFIQAVKKFRKDVRIVNLSLLNARWYIKQLKKIPPTIEFSYDDETIDRELIGAIPLYNKDFNFKYGNIEITIKKGNFLRVQDIGVMEIIRSNFGKRPICFSRTVGPDGRLGLDKYFVMKGMCYEVVDTLPSIDTVKLEDGSIKIDTIVGPIVDIPTTEDLIVNKFKYTNLNDSTTWLGKEGSRYIYGYVDLFKILAEAYTKKGNDKKALEILKKGIEYLPYVGMSYTNVGDYYFEKGDYENAIKYYKMAQRDKRLGWYGLYYAAVSYKLMGNFDSALFYIEKALDMEQETGSIIFSSRIENAMFREAVSICIAAKNKQKAIEIIQNWLKDHPDDQLARQALSQIDELFKNTKQ